MELLAGDQQGLMFPVEPCGNISVCISANLNILLALSKWNSLDFVNPLSVSVSLFSPLPSSLPHSTPPHTHTHVQSHHLGLHLPSLFLPPWSLRFGLICLQSTIYIIVSFVAMAPASSGEVPYFCGWSFNLHTCGPSNNNLNIMNAVYSEHRREDSGERGGRRDDGKSPVF